MSAITPITEKAKYQALKAVIEEAKLELDPKFAYDLVKVLLNNWEVSVDTKIIQKLATDSPDKTSTEALLDLLKAIPEPKKSEKSDESKDEAKKDDAQLACLLNHIIKQVSEFKSKHPEDNKEFVSDIYELLVLLQGLMGCKEEASPALATPTHTESKGRWALNISSFASKAIDSVTAAAKASVAIATTAAKMPGFWSLETKIRKSLEVMNNSLKHTSQSSEFITLLKKIQPLISLMACAQFLFPKSEKVQSVLKHSETSIVWFHKISRILLVIINTYEEKLAPKDLPEKKAEPESKTLSDAKEKESREIEAIEVSIETEKEKKEEPVIQSEYSQADLALIKGQIINEYLLLSEELEKLKPESDETAYMAMYIFGLNLLVQTLQENTGLTKKYISNVISSSIEDITAKPNQPNVESEEEKKTTSISSEITDVANSSSRPSFPPKRGKISVTLHSVKYIVINPSVSRFKKTSPFSWAWLGFGLVLGAGGGIVIAAEFSILVTASWLLPFFLLGTLGAITGIAIAAIFQALPRGKQDNENMWLLAVGSTAISAVGIALLITLAIAANPAIDTLIIAGVVGVFAGFLLLASVDFVAEKVSSQINFKWSELNQELDKNKDLSKSHIPSPQPSPTPTRFTFNGAQKAEAGFSSTSEPPL